MSKSFGLDRRQAADDSNPSVGMNVGHYQGAEELGTENGVKLLQAHPLRSCHEATRAKGTREGSAAASRCG